MSTSEGGGGGAKSNPSDGHSILPQLSDRDVLTISPLALPYHLRVHILFIINVILLSVREPLEGSRSLGVGYTLDIMFVLLTSGALISDTWMFANS